MLTIKKPIALHTTMTLGCDTGGFAQRMLANYAMMGTTVKPKELLFYVTAPMELPEEWRGAQTSLQLSTHVQNNQEVSLSVTNNLINRILLEHNTPFTYQDTVYISTVLRQLGVEEVNHFISEVRRLRKEQISAHTISKLYEKVNHTGTIVQTLLRQERDTLHKTTQQEGKSPQGEVSQDNYLFQHIFNRLDSKTIYQGVHAFQGHIRQSEFNPTQAQLRLTEHIRTSQALERTELRTNLLGEQQLTLEHVTNLYEQGDGLSVPQTQEQVLNQITQATLMHMVTQALSQELVYNKIQKQQWVNFDRTIAQMAEHSLARYEQFHSQPISHSHHHAQHTAVQQTMTAVELQQLQSLLQWSQTYEHTTAVTNQPPGQSPEHILHVTHPHLPEGQEQTISFQMPEGEVSLSQIETAMERIVDKQTTHHAIEVEHQLHQRETATQEQRLLHRTAEKELRETIHKLSELHALDHAVEQIWQRETTLSPTLMNLLGQWYTQTITQGNQTYNHHQHLLQQQVNQVLTHKIDTLPQTEEALLEQVTQTLEQSIHQQGRHTTNVDQSTQELTQLVEQSYQNQIEQQLRQSQAFQLQQQTQTHIHQQQTLQWRNEEEPLSEEAVTETPQERLPEGGQSSLTQVSNTQIDHATKLQQDITQLTHLQKEQSTQFIQNQIHNQQVLQNQQDLRTTYYQQITREVQRIQQEQTQRYHTIEEQVFGAEQADKQHPYGELPVTFVYPSQGAYPSQEAFGQEFDVFVQEGDQLAGDTQIHTTQVNQQQIQTQEEHYAQIAQSVQLIEQQNKERLHTLQEQSVMEQLGFATPKADAMRTLTHAQKALEDPTMVEGLKGAPPLPTQPTMPPQLQKIIQQADPQQQALFQQIFQMGQNPQVPPQGMQPSDVAALTRDIKQAELDWGDPIQMQHPTQEGAEPWQDAKAPEEIYNPIAQTYAQFTHPQGYGAKSGKGKKPTKPTLVHRQDTSFQTLLEEMEERHTQQVLAQQQTVHTLEQTNTQNIQTHQINHQEIQHQVEDISNLVRTTLTGQMSYITDQVYHQMERRLEMERSRRGR